MLALLGCSEKDSPTGPEPGPLSDVPVVAWVAARPGRAQSVAYVSLRAGSTDRPGPLLVSIPKSGRVVSAYVFNSGFDPVAIPANVGDRIVISETTEGPSLFEILVPGPAAPVVLRSNPVSQATAVALQPGLTFQFSEPMAIVPPTQTGTWLSSGGVSLPGWLEYVNEAHTSVRFVPTHSLAPNSQYTLDLTDAVRDLDGNAVASPVTLSFSTWQGSLVFSATPVQSNAGTGTLGPVTVNMRNGTGQAVDYSGAVHVALGSNPSNATLSGTTIAYALNGRATFSNLQLSAVGAGYTLVVTAPGVPPTTSAPFDMRGRLFFMSAPSIAYSGITLEPLLVSALGLNGAELPDFNGPVTIAVSTGSNGTLTGTMTVNAVAGRATFADLVLTSGAPSVQLVASASGFANQASAPFQFAPFRLAFLDRMVTPLAGSVIAPAVRVSVVNSANQPIAGFTGDVTLALTGPSATLFGTRTVRAINGVATFSDLRIDGAGSGYSLTASTACCGFVASPTFAVAAGRFSFITEATNARMGEPLTPAVRVAATDATGATVTTFQGSITIELDRYTSATTPLSGTRTATAVDGVATFSDLQINTSGEGFRLLAYGPGLADGLSAPFSVTGAWMPLASMLTPRAFHASAVVNGRLYVIGGYDETGGQLASVEVYDPATNSWTARAPWPHPRSPVKAVAINGIIYVVGGWDNSAATQSVDAYDPVSNTWSLKTYMPSLRRYVGAGAVNGLLYVVGGSDANGLKGNLVQAYDPVTNVWTTRTPMPTPRFEPNLIALNGLLYAITGYGDYYDNPVLAVESYDPATNAWTSRAPFPSSNEGNSITATVVGNRIFTMGGWSPEVLIYYATTSIWGRGASFPTSRAGGVTGTIGGIIYHAGGYLVNANESWVITPELVWHNPDAP